MVTGHLREKNGYFQMILTYKDMNGKRQTKSVSTGLPVKGNKKRAEALLWKTRQEFNPDTGMSCKNALFADFLKKWLQDVINRVDADTYALYTYDAKAFIIPYFKDKGKSIYLHDPHGLAAKAYEAFTKEVRDIGEKRRAKQHKADLSR